MTRRDFLIRFITDCAIKSDESVTVFEIPNKWLDQQCNTDKCNALLNDMTHMFDGLKEIPADFFKGWSTEEMKKAADNTDWLKKHNNAGAP